MHGFTYSFISAHSPPHHPHPHSYVFTEHLLCCQRCTEFSGPEGIPASGGWVTVASLGWCLFHRIFVKNSWMLRVTGRFSRVCGPLGDASRAWTPVGDQWDGSGPKVDFLWVETMESQVHVSWYGWPGLRGSDEAHRIWLYGPPSSFLLVYTTSRI